MRAPGRERADEERFNSAIPENSLWTVMDRERVRRLEKPGRMLGEWNGYGRLPDY